MVSAIEHSKLAGNGKRISKSRSKEGKGLTDKQRRFIAEYCTNGYNATRAAKSAGCNCKDEGSFAVSGVSLLRNSNVRAAIDDHFRAMHMSSDEVLARMVEQATANPVQFFDKAWRLKRSQVEKNGHLIRKLKCPVGSGKNRKPAEIELYDGQAALVKVGQHLGLFSDKVAVVGDQGGPVRHEFTIHVSPGKVDATGPKQIQDAAPAIDVEVSK